jgi:hypothetical protein
MKFVLNLLLMVFIVLVGCSLPSIAQTQNQSTEHRTKPKKVATQDAEIVTAVKAAAKKDCGCGECAAKGCQPCHGKNCYYCVAKGLTTQECGCGMCDPKGCKECGPGCDVCKFHLAPLEKKKNGSNSK